MMPRGLTCIYAAAIAWATTASAAFTNFVNFETAPVHPIELGPDSRTLAVCNLPDNRVELFDVNSGVPVPIGSVAVGLDPVSVRFASSNELWVVNHISSTISIVDVAARAVVATLETEAGPSDVVFESFVPRRAWVSCSRANVVRVFNVSTRLRENDVIIPGERPRAMATSPDGRRIYVAIFESGNGTTILAKRASSTGALPVGGPISDATGPYAGASPPPNNGTEFFPPIAITNTPPKVNHIVRRNSVGRWLDDNNADWTEWVSGTNAATSGRIPGWDMPDRDVIMFSPGQGPIAYAQRLMNLCMAMAVNPVTGEIAVVGTDGTNEKRFEPVLKGVFHRVKLALVNRVTQTNRVKDLNPHLDYQTRSLPPEQRALGLGDPRGIAWNSNGTRAYITGMGSRNMIIVDANGDRVNQQPIELGEGPTGIAVDEARSRLYVWNRFSSSISVVDPNAGVVITNVSVFDPTPAVVRRGRRHLFDTRDHSGLGIASCASCHPDVRMDRLAWDLGDPSGSMITNTIGNGSVGVFHPMKGPMVTQTLQDIIHPASFNPQTQEQKFALHWRGDRKGIEDFNQTFPALLAKDSELTTNEMADLKEMLASVFFPPNRFRNFDNSLPTSLPLVGHLGRPPFGPGDPQPLPNGNAVNGRSLFVSQAATCRSCHAFNDGRGGAPTNTFSEIRRNGTEGPFLISQLRSLPDKLGFNMKTMESRAGFGLLHDGGVDTLTEFLVHGVGQDVIPDDNYLADFMAFLLAFNGFTTPGNNPNQSVPAATGKQVTLSSPVIPSLLTSMFNLAMQPSSQLELVLRGKKDERMRSWLLRRSPGDFQSDRHAEIVPTISDIIATAAVANEFTATLVPEGSGTRLALDRDGDGYFDATETDQGYDPADPTSRPGRIISITRNGNDVTITWESAPGLKYGVETTTSLLVEGNSGWSILASPLVAITNVTSHTNSLPTADGQRFYRIRKEP